jgi:hypothetical protein
MNEAKLNRRIPVWIALSELYLDTDIENSDYDRIVQVLKTSEFSLDELKAIDLYELFPTLQSNLNSVIGEWGGFDEEWLISKCKRNFKLKNWRIRRSYCDYENKKHYWMRENCWLEIEKRFLTIEVE